MSAKDRLFCTDHTFPVDGIGKVTIRQLSEEESESIYDGMAVKDGKIADMRAFRRRLVSLSVKAIDGEPVTLTEDEVRRINWTRFQPIWEEVGKHTGFVDDGEQPGNSTTEPST